MAPNGIFKTNKKTVIHLELLNKTLPLCRPNKMTVIVQWCNGSTIDSGPVSPGSNPG